MTYPDGGHQVGDIFELPKEQVLYYEKISWVEVLPQEMQPKAKRGKKRAESIVFDLSKSKQVGRYLEHIYKGG